MGELISGESEGDKFGDYLYKIAGYLNKMLFKRFLKNLTKKNRGGSLSL